MAKQQRHARTQRAFEKNAYTYASPGDTLTSVRSFTSSQYEE